MVFFIVQYVNFTTALFFLRIIAIFKLYQKDDFMKQKDQNTRVIEENNLFRDIHRNDLVACYKLVGRLAEEMADSVRNPMTTVQGILQLVYHNELNFNKNLINVAIDEIKVIDTNINYLLNLSENKRIELEEANINDIITSTVDELNNEANKDQHNIILHLDPHLSTLLLDKKDIRQFLISAIQNGLEALSMNGVLEIKTKED